MNTQGILSIGYKPSIKVISLLILFVLIPNMLGMVNLSTPIGVKFHFFQLAIFLAAIIFGPLGGVLSGLFGSIYSAFSISNPYIIAGNMILGFFVGFFIRRGMNTIIAVMLAYLIQLIWLIPTDLYLTPMTSQAVKNVVVALALSNTIWAFVAHFISKPIKSVLD